MAADLIDTHAHLTYSPLVEQLDLILARARASGVTRVITIGTDPDDSREALARTENHPELFAAIGIHPHEADRYADVEELRPLLGRSKLLGLGETGLDYHYAFAQRDNQQRLFQATIALARETGLPLIVHCREAFDDVMSMLQSAGRDLGGVFHCFSGDEIRVRRVLDLGFFPSFSGTVTFKNAQTLRRAARYAGPDHLLVETDCPFLAPEPVRKNRTNEPANVLHIAKLLAGLFNLSLEEFATRVGATTRHVFGPALDRYSSSII